MNRFHVIAATAAALAAGPALAGTYTEGPADPVIVTPVTVAPSADWTGGYIGGGLGFGNAEGPDQSWDPFLYGIQAGYDYDFGTFVLGGEVEYLARDMWENNAADSTRLKGRFGYDMGSTMLYGVAGGSMIDNQWGYNVGVGAEHMLNANWSIGAEYIYETISDFDDNPGDFTTNSVTARVNYRF